MNEGEKDHFSQRKSSATVREYNTRNVQKKDKSLRKTRKTKRVSSSKKKSARGKENARPGDTKKSYKKVSGKSNSSEAVSTTTIETPEYQMEKVKQILQKPLSKILLTSEELQKLSMKYKLDGHYRMNLNLPPFDTLLGNSQFGNLEVSSSIPQNLENRPQNVNTDRYEETGPTNGINYEQFCIEGNAVVNHNYQHVLPHAELTDFNNMNTLHLNEFSNRNAGYYTYGVADSENSMRYMDQQDNVTSIMNNTNILCNDSNIPNNILQQYNVPYRMHYKNLTELNNANTFRGQQTSWKNVALINPVVFNDNSFGPNKLTNDNFLLNNNNTRSLYAPHTTDTGTYLNNMYNVNNSTIMCQSMNTALTENYPERENDYDTNYAVSMCPLTLDSRNLICDYSTTNPDPLDFNNFSHENNVCTQSSTAVMSDAMNFLLEEDACAMSLVNTNEVYKSIPKN